MDDLAPGRTGRLIDGPFADFRATVVGWDGDALRLDVEIFGRRTEISVRPEQFESDTVEGDPTPRMWAAVERELPRRGFDQRRAHWWAKEARENRGLTPTRLMAEFEAFDAELTRETEALRAELWARFEATFGPLSPQEKLETWRRTKDEWVWPRARVRETFSDLDRELVGDAVPDTERLEKALELLTLGSELRRSTERAVIAERRRREPLGEEDARTRPIARNKDLERAIEQAPDDREPYQVYADFLEEQGDPRGEVISAHLSPRGNAERLIEEHGTYLLGGLRNYLGPVELEWYAGFIRAARIALTYDEYNEGIDARDLLATLLDLHATRFLQSLTLGAFDYRGNNDYDALLRILARRRRPSLRSLFIGDTTADQQEISWTRAGDLSRLPAALPNLRNLKIHAGSMSLGSLDFPKLETLVVETGGLSLENLRILDAGTWPELVELSIWFGQRTYGAKGGVEDIGRILAGDGIPKIRRLGLMNAEFSKALVEAVLNAGVLPRLEELDLSLGVMSDDGAAALLAGAAYWRHLKRLVVSENYLSGEAIQRLRSVGPEIVSTLQKEAHVYEGQTYRYPSVGE